MTETPAPLRDTYEHAVARRGLSIHVRLLLLVMAAALPALVFSLFQARTASRIERGQAEQRALQLARRIATRVDDHVNMIDALLIGLSQTVQVAPGSLARNDSILASVRHDLGSREVMITVADSLGHVVGLTHGGSARSALTIGDRKYFREAMRTRGLGIGEPMVGRVSGQYSVALGRAILGPAGRPLGVVAASTLLGQLRALLVPADLPDEAVVTLVDGNGVVLSRTRDTELTVGQPMRGLLPAGLNVTAREGVSEVTGSDGVALLSGHATASRVPWSVYVGIPSALALARVHAQERQAMVLFAGSLTLSLLFAWLLARGIAGPVRALTADADAFAAGKLVHRSQVVADGELGILAQTFNRMVDALERRSAQLGASEVRYRALFETMPLPMWVYDVDTMRFLVVNQAAVDRYGYTREEFEAMTLFDLRPAEETTLFREAVSPARNSRVRGEIWHHLTKAGEIIDVEISSDALEHPGQRSRLVVANDVTARRSTELALRASQEQLRQSQKMEAIGSLAGGIAHDFNNLLTAILGYCDLALEGIAAESTASDDVAEIRRAALRAADLTHQLLAFSRRQVLKPLVFPLGVALAGTEKILRRLISENIVLVVHVADDTPHVCADPTQLEQVMLNLAVNARDAMPRGGQLRVRTGSCQLGAPRDMSGTTLKPGCYATLAVTDTGTGIAPEVIDRVFEPFFTTKERGQGTGLGLATVYGIVQQSGGGIDVVSEVGRGTTFTLYFPAATPGASDEEPGGWASSVAPRPATAAAARADAMILLAEDDDAVRAIARETLERAGYRVMAAADGRSAMALAGAHAGPIDLLLTDVIMPGMNGRELAELLAIQRPGLRVLFASGYSDNVLLDQGALAPGVTLLDKPFTPSALAMKVAEILAQPRPVLAAAALAIGSESSVGSDV